MMTVEEAITGRHCYRAFLPKPVPRDLVARILAIAGHAPSGSQNVMVAARPFGLETCPQAAFLDFHAVLLGRLGIPPGETIVCGMALGYPDPDEPVNTFSPERIPVEEFVTWVDA